MIKRLGIILFLILSVCTVHSQQTLAVFQQRISVHASAMPMADLLTLIEGKSDIVFSYNSNLLEGMSRISFRASNETVLSVIKRLLDGKLEFAVKGNNVILTALAVPGADDLLSQDKLRKKKKKGQKPLVSESIILHDTVWQTRTEIVERVRVDTVVKTVIDSVPKPKRDSVVAKPSVRKFTIEPFCQYLMYSSQYNHFGLNTKAKLVIPESEKPATGYRTGLMFSFVNNSLRFSSGLAFLRTNENFDYPDSVGYKYTVKMITDPKTKDSIFVMMIDTIVNPYAGKNTYTYLSLPLFIGWEHQLTKKITLSINAGVWINFLLSVQGKYIDLQKNYYVYTTEKPSGNILNPDAVLADFVYSPSDIQDAPLNKLTFDFAADVSLQYELFRKFYLKAGVSYLKQAGSEFNNDYPVTKQKNAIGLAFSLVKSF